MPKKLDWLSISLYLLIVLFGWVNIYAACYSEAHSAIFDFSSQHGRQIIWMGVAFLFAIIILFIEPRLFSNIAYIIYGVALILLIVTLLVATATKGAVSWLNIGPFKFQPSEFAKFATALALAKYLSAINIDMRQMRTKVIAAIIIGVPAMLILLQNDTGSALVFAAFVFPLYRQGLTKYVLIFALVAIVLFVLALLVKPLILIAIIVTLGILYLFVWLNKRYWRDYLKVLIFVVCCCAFVFSVSFVFEHVLQDHQRARIEVLLGKSDDIKGAGYNVNQSKIAIGSGGLFGKHFLGGTITKADFVPEQETDFIFCTVGEEWGFLGSALLVAAYVILLVHLITMAERQRSPFARIYGYSVASILFLHLLINVGMVLGLLPVIGIPLPLFSYGGSSMLAFTILLFIFIRQDAERNLLL